MKLVKLIAWLILWGLVGLCVWASVQLGRQAEIEMHRQWYEP